ncbi:MAG: 1-(5-phosphoribosyl)-5-[(5-phosphoribosylamino)methylideneamino]imidazole-4-carboxamide isomerase, partial [Thermoplasmatota archaeon]
VTQATPLQDGGAEPHLGEQAARFAKAGVDALHVVDCDAQQGGHNQWHHLAHALGHGIPLQFGGGVRRMTQVQQLLDLGVERVVVGTQAVLNPLWFRELCRVFPRRIVLEIMCAEGQVLLPNGASHGPAVDLARTLDDGGAAALHFTFVAPDGGPQPVDRATVGRVRKEARTPLLVGGEMDVADLDWLAGEGVAGAVVGTPLYTGAVAPKAALPRFRA